MTRTSWQFPMKCRFSVQHSGGYKPSLLGVSRGRVPAWVCVILSRFATSWSVNLPTRLAGVILRFYLLIWVLLFHYIGENTGSNGKAYRTDRQTDRCTGEPLSFSCPKDSEGPLQWRWNDASFPAGGGRADPGPGFHPSVGCSVWSCQPFHGQAVKTPQLRHLLTHINSSHSTEQYSRSVFWIPGDVCPGRSHGCLGIMSKAVLSPTCVLSSLAKL